jgi:hypothetical protein
MKKLKLYWSRSKPNFGDVMSPIICERLARRPVVYASKRHCDLVAMGSLLDRFKERLFHARIHVWGTGFIEEKRPRKSRFHYHALRGRHSARLIKGLVLDTYGDPGLLADVLWPELRKVTKRYRVGIVPHYEDRDDPKVKAIANQLFQCTVIDVFDDVTEVLRQIASCEFVLSSSLHGLIVADAFGTPNAWIKVSDKVRGDDFKFYDYYSIYDLDRDMAPFPVERISERDIRRATEEYSRPGVDDIKYNLIRAFPFKP